MVVEQLPLLGEIFKGVDLVIVELFKLIIMSVLDKVELRYPPKINR